MQAAGKPNVILFLLLTAALLIAVLLQPTVAGLPA